MEPTNKTTNTAPPKPVEAEKPKLPTTNKATASPKGNNFLVTLLSLLLLLAVGAAGFFAWQTQNLVKQINEMKTSPTPLSSPEPTTQTATPDPTATWKTYVNIKYGFAFKYPDTFKTEVLAAERQSEADSNSRNFYVYEKGSESKYEERYLNFEVTSVEPNYQGTITQTKINDIDVKKVNIPNTEFDIYSLKLSDGEYLEIYVSSNSKRGTVSSQIFSTFKFVEPEATASPVACTEEAKVCPDGSSVGRTGPNCEFTPCPTPTPSS